MGTAAEIWRERVQAEDKGKCRQATALDSNPHRRHPKPPFTPLWTTLEPVEMVPPRDPFISAWPAQRWRHQVQKKRIKHSNKQISNSKNSVNAPTTTCYRSVGRSRSRSDYHHRRTRGSGIVWAPKCPDKHTPHKPLVL